MKKSVAGYANNRFTIPVAAVVSGGAPAWYSEPCAVNFCTVPSSGGAGGGGSINLVGFPWFDIFFFFCVAVRTIDLNGRCTSSFGGTSAAAPQMAGEKRCKQENLSVDLHETLGVVALMLEANPNLGWRDVQHLVATNAVRDNLQQTTGWTRNGLSFFFFFVDISF